MQQRPKWMFPALHSALLPSCVSRRLWLWDCSWLQMPMMFLIPFQAIQHFDWRDSSVSAMNAPRTVDSRDHKARGWGWGWGEEAQLQRSVLQHVANAPGVFWKPWHTAMFMHWRKELPRGRQKGRPNEGGHMIILKDSFTIFKVLLTQCAC